MPSRIDAIRLFGFRWVLSPALVTVLANNQIAETDSDLVVVTTKSDSHCWLEKLQLELLAPMPRTAVIADDDDSWSVEDRIHSPLLAPC